MVKPPIFQGACTAMITPFRHDGSIDYERTSKLIDRQISAGIDALCICGTTGESATMSIKEHEDYLAYCIKYINGRCKVIAGTGSNDTQTSIHLSRHADELGADALLIVTPYYNKTTQKGLVLHYNTIANRVQTPIILYNVPSRTGIGFTDDTYKRLSEHPNICGIKEASGDFSLIANTMAQSGSDLHMWSGNDDQVVPMMSLGASGVISVLSNLLPEVMVEMTHEYLNGNTKKAMDIQLQYTKLIALLFSEVNPIPIKMAMHIMDLDTGILRLPLCEMAIEKVAKLKAEMERLQII